MNSQDLLNMFLYWFRIDVGVIGQNIFAMFSRIIACIITKMARNVPPGRGGVLLIFGSRCKSKISD